MNKTLQRHLDAILSGTVERGNVIGLRKAINLMERAYGGWSVPSYVTKAWRAEVMALEEALEASRPVVSGELHDSGLEVLRNPRYRKRWTWNEAAIIAELDHFRLLGFDRLGSHGQYATPVYRACGKSGLGFNFRNVPWQSGGNGPEIVSWID